MEQDWFEMNAVRRRRFADVVWVPLKKNDVKDTGSYGHIGFISEFDGVGSMAIPLSAREAGDRLFWSDIGLNDQRSYAFPDSYKPVDVYQYSDEEDLGIALVLTQDFQGEDPSVWHLSQDMVFAFGLLRENDTWVRPEEGYVEVVRLKRNDENIPILMEIRADYLRDYLAARQMALRITRYHSRLAILENIEHLNWGEETFVEEEDGGRFEGSVTKTLAGGRPVGSSIAVFQVSRNDVDPEEDVPVLGPESDGNTDQKTWTKTFTGEALFRVEGACWIDEWIEPSDFSPRIRRDNVPSSCEFYIDASGAKENADNLNNEEVGRWLWFRSEVVAAVLEGRGTALEWYSKDTGGLKPCPGYTVHFGVNEQQLITAYAFDVARLPEWQRRFWVGYNVTPEGGIGEELHAAQIKTVPANTQAPEHLLEISFDRLDKLFLKVWGEPLFREHKDTKPIIQNVHRFRAKDQTSLLALAKDIARLTADRINVDVLHKIAPPPDGQKLGSLKSLESVLATFIGKDDARSALTSLAGIYELRLGDAHLASSKLHEAMELVPIDPKAPPIVQGFQLIEATVSALRKIGAIVIMGSKESGE